MCKRINIFLPILMVFYFGGSIAVSVLIANTGIDVPYWLLLIAGEILLMIPAAGYVFIMKISIRKCLPYRLLKAKDAILALLTGYALIPAVLVINAVTMLFSTNHLNSIQGGLGEYPFIIQLVLIAVVPAIVEEFVFRGLFYHSYRKNGIPGAALTSALLFGIMHLNINQFCYAFCIGIVFAIMVEATGSMFASMLAHFAVNSYSVIVLEIVSKVSPDTIEKANSISSSGDAVSVISVITIIAVWGVIAAGGIAIAVLLIRKMAKNNGRYEYLRNELKKGPHAFNGEKFITVPALITIILSVAYMIYTG